MVLRAEPAAVRLIMAYQRSPIGLPYTEDLASYSTGQAVMTTTVKKGGG